MFRSKAEIRHVQNLAITETKGTVFQVYDTESKGNYNCIPLPDMRNHNYEHYRRFFTQR